MKMNIINNIQGRLLRCCLFVFCSLILNGCGIFPSTYSCYNPTYCAELRNGIWGEWHSLIFPSPRAYISYNSYSYDIYIYTSSHPSEYDLKVSINKSSAVNDKDGTSYNGKVYVKEDFRLAKYSCFSPVEMSFLPPRYGPRDDVNVQIRGDKKFSRSIENGGLYGVVMIYYGNEEGIAFFFGPQ